MKSYNEKIAPLKNVELVMMSYDKAAKDTLAWAKKESFPWPTVLWQDTGKVHFGSAEILSIPTYLLFDKNGNCHQRQKKYLR